MNETGPIFNRDDDARTGAALPFLRKGIAQ